MKTLIIAIALLAAGCSNRKVEIPGRWSMAPGYAKVTAANGLTLMILRDSSAYQQALKDLCAKPCAVESIGEAFILEPLK